MLSHHSVTAQEMKQSNRWAILSRVFDARSISRPQLARSTGMSVMSVGRIADELISLGVIRDTTESGVQVQGRPARLLELCRDQLLCASALMDRERIDFCVADPYGEEKWHETISLPDEYLLPEKAVALLAGLYREAERRYHVLPSFGVAMPGSIDHDTGFVRYSAQFKWHDVPLGDLISAQLEHVTVSIENDVKAWAHAELFFGEAQHLRSAVMLSVGSGIGSASIIDRHLHRGQGNLAGEIGHIRIGSGGQMCTCGQIGCLHSCLTDNAVLQQARIAQPGIAMEELKHEMENGTPWAAALWHQMTEALSLLIDLLINAFAPDIVIVCGRMIEYFPSLLPAATTVRQSSSMVFLEAHCPIISTRFGLAGYRLGMCAVALRRWLQQII